MLLRIKASRSNLFITTKSRLADQNSKQNEGYILPLVITVGLILTVGGFALLTRTFGGFMGSIRSEQARQAREIAEGGMAETIENLNRKFNYLLINCYDPSISNWQLSDKCQNIVFDLTAGTSSRTLVGLWNSPRYPSAVCPGVQRAAYDHFSQSIEAPRGDYRVLRYIFDGTQFYGGKGTLSIEGTRRSSDNQILATAVIEQTFEVKPKNCGANFKGNANNSGFPGLLASKINLGNNDVKGSISGNILCTGCEYSDPLNPQPGEELALIQANTNNAEVDGEIFIGEITMPDVWPIPANIRKAITQVTENANGTPIIRSLQENINKESGTNTYKISSQPAPNLPLGESMLSHGGMCATDQANPAVAAGEPITYCIVSSIVLANTQQLEVDTSNGPVKLYVTGDVDVGGQRSLKQTRNDGLSTTAFRLGLFGLNESECSSKQEQDSSFQQDVKVAGVSKTSKKDNGGEEAKAANVFIHFPCGKVGISGGAQSEAECNTTDESITPENALEGQVPYGDCGGGDIRGVVWAQEWDGSGSNNAQLVVPRNAADDGLSAQGFEYAISVKDYVAIGTNSWFGFGGVPRP